MDYIQYQFKIQPRDPWVDILISELGDLFFESFEDAEQGFNAYIQKKEWSERVDEFISSFKQENSIELNYTTVVIPAQNWNAEWENSFEPVKVEKFCTIRADFHDLEPTCKYEIIITPKMSFGTGHHPTTYLMVRAMENIDFTSKRVLDMGCGTGVLGILASKLQAKEVVGIDIEDWALENSIENAQKNSVSIQFILGGKEQLDTFSNKSFDVVLANINRNILLDQLSEYARKICTGGLLLLSGFMKEDIDKISDEAVKQGFELYKEDKKEQWICLVFQKK